MKHNIASVTFKDITNLTLLLFILLPLMYPIQVITNQLLLTFIIYISLAILAIYHLINLNSYRRLLFHEISLSLFILSTFISIFINYHDPIDTIKIFCFYILPISIMFSIKEMNINQISFLVKITLLLSSLFALELIHELVELETTWYQQKNFDYIHSRYGAELWQLLGSQRSTGMMEHLHVTALFLTIGIITVNAFLLTSQNKIFLWIICIILWMGLFANASRLIIIGIFTFTMLSYTILLFKQKIRSMYIINYISIIIFSFLILYFLTFKNTYFWHDIYFQLLPSYIITFFQNGLEYIHVFFMTTGSSDLVIKKVGIIPNQEIMPYVVTPSLNSFFYLVQNASLDKLFFGYSFGQSAIEHKILNDDFFIVQFILQTGIIGFGLFIISFISIIAQIIFYLKKAYSIHPKIMAFMFISSGIIFMLSFSMLHSSVILKKYIFPFIFLAAGMLSNSLLRLQKD